MTADDLGLIMIHAPRERLELFLEPLNDAMYSWSIDESPARMAAFLAQVAVESGELRYTAEIASGEAYERRVDLGNVQPGDGVRFKGRGLIQITGRFNYSQCSDGLYDDQRLIDEPTLLESPSAAADSAGWFWASHELNELADQALFLSISSHINGINRQTGLPNAYPQRVAYWSRAKTIFGVQSA